MRFLKKLPWFVLVAIGGLVVYVLYKRAINVRGVITVGEPTITYH